MSELLSSALRGDRRALARSITLLEAGHLATMAALAALPVRRLHRPGSPQVVGITGPPGAGKSSFVDRLIHHGRKSGQRVAVVAVDPSSPFSGGAILGDRVRMDRHADDPGVYIRSLSARGAAGGLSRAAGQVVDLFDAVGFDLVLVETVGVGQGELAVMEVADSVLVVLTPESGDTVQTMKAGLLEVADVFCVNKADRPGADGLCRDLELSVHLDDRPGWTAPVFTSVATQDRGVDDVLGALRRHREWLMGEGLEFWQRRRAEGRVHACLELVAEHARFRAIQKLAGGLGERLRSGAIRPEEAAALLEQP